MTVLLYKRADKFFYLPLVLAFGFLGSYTGVHQCYGRIKSLKESLEPKELALYKQVEQERKNVYFTATLQALLVVIAYIIFHLMFGCQTSPYYFLSNILCLFLGSTFLFYTLMTKKKSMILDANLSPDETKRWYHVYLCMQESFWSGFVWGLLVSAFLMMLLDALLPKGELVQMKMGRPPRRRPKKKSRSGKK